MYVYAYVYVRAYVGVARACVCAYVFAGINMDTSVSVIFQVCIFKTLLTKEKVADALIYCNEQLENMELLRRYIPRQRLCFTQEGWVPPS